MGINEIGIRLLSSSVKNFFKPLGTLRKERGRLGDKLFKSVLLCLFSIGIFAFVLVARANFRAENKRLSPFLEASMKTSIKHSFWAIECH